MLERPCFVLLLTATACAGSAANRSEGLPGPGGLPAQAYEAPGYEPQALASIASAESVEASDAAPAMPRSEGRVAQAGGRAAPGQEREKLIIEATLVVRVSDLDAAAVALREATRAVGGKLASEDLNATDGYAHVTARVPPEQVEAFYEAVAKLGELRSRSARATDVTKQFMDYKVALDNATKTVERYQEILKAATTVNDMLQVEAQLSRVKGEIERLKGELGYLNDRVQLATITVSLQAERVAVPTIFAPEAKFYPGFGVSHLWLLDTGRAARTYPGAVATVGFDGGGKLELFVGSEDTDPVSAEVYELTLGVDAYSDFLGRGERQFGNPHLGLELGAGWLGERAFGTAAATLGVELVKTKHVLLDARAQVGAWMRRSNVLGTVQTTLALSVAF